MLTVQKNALGAQGPLESDPPTGGTDIDESEPDGGSGDLRPQKPPGAGSADTMGEAESTPASEANNDSDGGHVDNGRDGELPKPIGREAGDSAGVYVPPASARGTVGVDKVVLAVIDERGDGEGVRQSRGCSGREYNGRRTVIVWTSENRGEVDHAFGSGGALSSVLSRCSLRLVGVFGGCGWREHDAPPVVV